MQQGKRATSADVARAAGVSRATVSYVLNRTAHQSIPDATRTRVLEAAERLNYLPSASARTLRRGHSDLILCLLPDWPLGPLLSGIIDGLTIALLEHGLTMVTHAHSGQARPLSELWNSINPAAVLLLGPLDPADEQSLRNAQVEVVTTGLSSDQGDRTNVLFPQERIGRLQVEHLAFAGHRRVGYAYPLDPRLAMFADGRLLGARAATADLRLDLPDVRSLDLEPGTAAAAIDEWRQQGVTGVCAYNDEIAAAILSGVRQRGLSIPANLAVIGADDIPMARLMYPPLTTVTVDAGAAVRALASSLLHRLTGIGTLDRMNSNSLFVTVRESA